MPDPRPLHSPTPAEAAAIGQQLVDQLKPMLDIAYDQIIALPGNPAERENDALSVLATIGGFVGLQLTARLMKTKRIDPETAMALAAEEMAQRIVAEFVGRIFPTGAAN